MTLLTAIRVLALSCFVAGCGGSSSSAHGNGAVPIAGSAAQPLAGMLPIVDGGDVLATVWADRGEPGKADELRRQVPVLVIVDARGEYRAAAPPLRWPELGAYQLEATKPLDVSTLHGIIAEGTAFAKTPREIVAELAASTSGAIDLSSNETSGTNLDDPPPPEDDDQLEDGADETGGTDSDRAEGQYKMRKTQDDPQLAAQIAKEKARAAALKAKGLFRGTRAPSRITTEPTRLSTVSGFIDPGEELPLQSAAIVAHPRAKAAAVVKLLAGGVGDSILVAHGKDVRPLRLLFGRAGVEPDRKAWIEVRAHQGAFLVEGVPGTPRRVPVPRDQLARRYAALVADARLGKASVVDVLVDDELTAQELIDVLVALDRAGARAIAAGHVPAPGSPQATLRGSSR